MTRQRNRNPGDTRRFKFSTNVPVMHNFTRSKEPQFFIKS